MHDFLPQIQFCSILFLSHPRFLLLWSAVLIMYPTTLAVIALTFSNYVLQPVFPDCVPPYMATRLLSTVCLCEYCTVCLTVCVRACLCYVLWEVYLVQQSKIYLM
jgi:hypothetical protein